MREEVIILDMKISANLLVLFLFFFSLDKFCMCMCILKFKHSVPQNSANFELGLMLVECKKTSQNNGPEFFLASG